VEPATPADAADDHWRVLAVLMYIRNARGHREQEALTRHDPSAE